MLAVFCQPMITLLAMTVVVVACTFALPDADEADSGTPSMYVALTAPERPLPAYVLAYRDLEYQRRGDQRMLLDLYQPTSSAGPHPLVMFIHGGGWRCGDKNQTRASQLAERGYIVASINYRSSDAAVFPAQLDDCRSALAWLCEHAAEYRIDCERIGVWGISSGGHLAALLAVTESEDACQPRIDAVVDFYGPTDLLTLDEDSGTGGALRHADPYSPESLLLGGPLEQRRDLAITASPLRQVRDAGGYPPFLIVHGRTDRVVPVEQSLKLAEALQQTGADVSMFLPVLSHHNESLSQPVYELVAAFFDRTLRVGDDAVASEARFVSQLDAMNRASRRQANDTAGHRTVDSSDMVDEQSRH